MPRKYRKVDGRRFLVVMHDGSEGYVVSWTQSCSGCHETVDGHETGDYSYDSKAQCYRGSGCPECGYSGKSRESHWVPFDPEYYEKAQQKEGQR